MSTVLKVNDLTVVYKMASGIFKHDNIDAVSHASLTLDEGEILGIVGESGCGKSTLCNAVLGFVPIYEGEISIYGKTINSKSKKKEINEYRSPVNVIFQNPFSALDSRLKVWEIISEPLHIRGERDEEKLKAKSKELLTAVGLNEEDLERYVFEFSGGQRQRIAIARALISDSKFIVLDEPTSALDVSVQSQICNLLIDLKKKYSLTYLFVSHNMPLIYQLCDKVCVMYCGQIVETGTADEVFKSPKHPYTKGLLASILDNKCDLNIDKRYELTGEVPSAIHHPKGCRFSNRCPLYCDECSSYQYKLEECEKNHYIACGKHFEDE